MAKLLFLSRVAVVCNGCFFILFLFHYSSFETRQLVPSTLIILGGVLSIFFNTIVIVIYFISFITSNRTHANHPAWMIATNFIFFIFQVILLIK